MDDIIADIIPVYFSMLSAVVASYFMIIFLSIPNKMKGKMPAIYTQEKLPSFSLTLFPISATSTLRVESCSGT